METLFINSNQEQTVSKYARKYKIFTVNIFLLTVLLFFIDIPSMFNINEYLIKYSAGGQGIINRWRINTALFLGATPNYLNDANRNALQISVVTDNRYTVELFLPESNCTTLKSAGSFKEKELTQLVQQEIDKRCGDLNS